MHIGDILVYNTIKNITKIDNIDICDIIKSYWVTKNFVQLSLDDLYDSYKPIFVSRITPSIFEYILHDLINFCCRLAECNRPDISNKNNILRPMTVYYSSIYGVAAEYLQNECNVSFNLDKDQLYYISHRGGMIGPDLTLREICNKVKFLAKN